jgi:hypothetical protein
VPHADAVGLFVAEPFGEVEQCLGHPPRDVTEDEVGHRLVGSPQPLRQRAEQLYRHPRLVEQQRTQVVVVERGECAVRDGGRGRGAWARVEQ